jgi:hypothetical protein
MWFIIEAIVINKTARRNAKIWYRRLRADQCRKTKKENIPSVLLG